MPFVSHTEADIAHMLEAIGAERIEDLFDQIPEALLVEPSALPHLQAGMNELAASQLMQRRAWKDQTGLCFIGAGAYAHHIPAAVWQIASRGEFLTSYTPYQAEASQGTLQVIHDYQRMMANLMGMEVSNASQYDGATALAEAVLMAVRLQKGNVARKVLVPGALNPVYQKVLQTQVQHQDIAVETLPYCADAGVSLLEGLATHEAEPPAALVIAQPNFFGMLESVDALTDWAHAHGVLVIAVVNPMAMALLKAPGDWGERGADIVCGEGQPLGVPLSCGGPYFGFLCCRKSMVRQMPGRIVGKTVDQSGREAYTLTLQAREQHIRRSKATSNICTNQGLLVTAAAIYMSLMGPQGLRKVALASHAHLQSLMVRLEKIDGVSRVFSGPYFHEQLIRFEQPVEKVLAAMAGEGIQGGFAIERYYPELGNALLVCATEIHTEQDLDHYAAVLARVLNI